MTCQTSLASITLPCTLPTDLGTDYKSRKSMPNAGSGVFLSPQTLPAQISMTGININGIFEKHVSDCGFHEKRRYHYLCQTNKLKKCFKVWLFSSHDSSLCKIIEKNNYFLFDYSMKIFWMAYALHRQNLAILNVSHKIQ